MPNITLTSHFVDELHLPHVETILLQSITIHEPYILERVLGYEMYKSLYSNLSNVSGIWYNLINGDEYTDDDGVLCKWAGFKTIGSNPIACYVYCKELEKNISQTTAIGETQMNNENMRLTSPIRKHVNAWNKMCDLFYTMDDYIMANIDDYTTYNGMNTANGYKKAVNFFTKVNEFGI